MDDVGTCTYDIAIIHFASNLRSPSGHYNLHDVLIAFSVA